MCGIAGYFGFEEIPQDRVDRCLALMRRRGPDATGSYRYTTPDSRQFLMLHSRLSIIDLDDRANQPFRCEGLVLAYNGELYNYMEVRDELRRAGH